MGEEGGGADDVDEMMGWDRMGWDGGCCEVCITVCISDSYAHGQPCGHLDIGEQQKRVSGFRTLTPSVSIPALPNQLSFLLPTTSDIRRAPVCTYRYHFAAHRAPTLAHARRPGARHS